MSILKHWFAKRAGLVNNRADSAQSIEPSRKTTVLVVDDSKTVLASLNKMMLRLGFGCLTAASALEGIECAKTHRPDLILMDIVMPEINGFEATRMLRNIPQTAHIPIIIISGTKLQTEQFWGLKIGANGFLPKPLDQHALLNLTHQLLNSKQVTANL